MPYWRLSGFYFFYFGALGVFVPYWAPYLRHHGFSPVEIGEIMAVVMVTKFIAPFLWGWVADHTGRRMLIVRWAALLAAVSFAGVLLGAAYWWLMLVMLVFSFFWNAALPQFEANTMNHLGDQSHRYSRIRMWGSIGFILAAVALGQVQDIFGPQVVPVVMLALLAGLACSTLLVPQKRGGSHTHQRGSLLSVLSRPVVISLFAVCFLLQLSHGPYYTFYSIHLEDHGYSRTMIGLLWALGVAAEIAVFLLMHRLLPKVGPRVLMLWTLGLTTLRWVIIAWFVQSPAVMVLAQLLHAASFGLYHAVAIYMINRFFVGRHQGRGQALYSSLSFGAGGAIGSLASGHLWGVLGPAGSYLLAAMISAIAFVVAWYGLRAGAIAASAK